MVCKQVDKVEEFIQRRFPNDSNWLNGNCFHFAFILQQVFGGEIVYQPVVGHAYCKMGDRYYDWEGKHERVYAIPLEKIQLDDPLWYERIIRDCVE